MVRKKTEGNEQQKRAAARSARRDDRLPSERGATTGASKQRHHLPVHDDHVEKVETIREGKPNAGGEASAPAPRPRSRRWHEGHQHDTREHPHPRDFETHPRKKRMP